MKHLALIVLSIFQLMRSSAYAQAEYVGVSFGINKTNVISNTLEPIAYKNGFIAGFTYDYELNSRISLGTGLNFDNRGFIFYPLNTTGTVYGIENYNYLSLPLKIVFRNPAPLHCFIGVGIDPSILLYAQTQWPIDPNNDFAVIKDNGASLLDFGAFIEPGIGYQVNKKLCLSLSLKGRYSFTSVTNANYNPYLTIQNYGFYFSLQAKYAMNILRKAKR